MSYLLLLLSLVLNGLLVWYVRKMLSKLQYEVDVRAAFTEMLQQYADSLEKLYKLEELYGEEIIKRAITETNFVIEACTEFKKAIEIGATQDEKSDTQEASRDQEELSREAFDQEGEHGFAYDGQANTGQAKKGLIRLGEGESVSQDASSYRRVRPADFSI